jgi:CHAT domain-containing protein
VTEAPEVLPAAWNEGQRVAACWGKVQWLHGTAASRATLQRHLPHARAAHFACHAVFDPDHPLSAHVRLPSGETWRGIDWIGEPLEQLPLVTLSACRSAQVGAFVGQEVFGLVTALLAAGVQAVLAGQWSVPDRETADFMGRFYVERLTCDLATALARTQRACLAEPRSSPLFWSVFALFGWPTALPAPSWWRRWLAAWQQRRLRRRHPEFFGGRPAVRTSAGLGDGREIRYQPDA